MSQTGVDAVHSSISVRKESTNIKEERQEQEDEPEEEKKKRGEEGEEEEQCYVMMNIWRKIKKMS